jgi:hypothetical protein
MAHQAFDYIALQLRDRVRSDAQLVACGWAVKADEFALDDGEL